MAPSPFPHASGTASDRHALGQTVQERRPSPGGGPPHLSRLTLEQQLAADPAATPASAPGPGRFATGQLLGIGASGSVWAVQDQDLGRGIALKVLEPDGALEMTRVQQFLDEARITASLAHPNVLPVHDVGLTEDGRPYLAMQQIEGASLESLLEQSTLDHRAEPVGSVAAVISVFISVCQALAHAHRRGIVHQDVKPANIVVGDLAEVLLVDWGSALRMSEPFRKDRLYGTPLYMSPEQARLEGSDCRSDLYSVGASLFHALTLRLPTWSEHAEVFWERKRRGAIDVLPAAVRARVPARALAIAMHALAPRPEDRYQSAEQMLRDLRAYQSGDALLAVPDQWWMHVARWSRRNRRLLLVCLVAMAATAILATGWYLERRKLTASWQVIYDQDMSLLTREELARDWDLWFSGWSRRPRQVPLLEDHQVGVGPEGLSLHALNNVRDLTWRHPVGGDLRVAWDVTPLNSTGNINCFIGGLERTSAYIIHIAGWHDPTYCALTEGEKDHPLDEAFLTTPIRAEQTYHCVLTRIGPRITLAINGRMVIDYRGAMPPATPSAQAFGFDGCYGAIWRIHHITISTRPLPEHLSPLAIPEHSAQLQQFDRATLEYQGIAAGYPDLELGTAARFGAAIAMARAGHSAEAQPLLRSLIAAFPLNPAVPDCLFELWRIAWTSGDRAVASQLLQQLAAYPHQPAQRALMDVLMQAAEQDVAQHALHRLGDPASSTELASLIASWYTQLKGAANTLGLQCADARFIQDATADLRHDGADDAVLRLFNDPNLDALALMDMGRYEEAMARCPSDQHLRAECLLAQDRPQEVLDGPFDAEVKNAARQQLGLPLLPANEEDLIPIERATTPTDVDTLFQHKDIDGMLRYAPHSWQCIELLSNAGRWEDALSAATNQVDNAWHIAFHAYRDGDHAWYEKMLPALRAAVPPRDQRELLVPLYVQPALELAWQQSSAAGIALLRRERARWPFVLEQRAAYVMGLVAGDCDEKTFLSQPRRQGAREWLPICHALQLDLQRRGAEALAAYTQLKPNLENWDFALITEVIAMRCAFLRAQATTDGRER